MSRGFLERELARFDASFPIEEASTPPASWYLSEELFEVEKSMLRASWQPVGRADQLADPGCFFAGEFCEEPYVVLRDEEGQLRALSSVCRHHGAIVASGEGRADCLECPYHGWTYGLDGRLTSAPRLGGVRDFDREQFGLASLRVATRGPLVLLHAGDDTGEPDRAEPVWSRLEATGWDGLVFAARRRYEMNCNWKVYVDNYLDGGYHVPVLHRGLAGQLDLDLYRTELFERSSIQSCPGARETASPESKGDFAERIGEHALYAFLHPNLMINRYGPWMDVNWVVPLSVDRTAVVFDYYLSEGAAGGDSEFVERSLEASDAVQEEDRLICESVQLGLRSGRYDRGRYAPRVEQAMHHFHRMLADDLAQAARTAELTR